MSGLFAWLVRWVSATQRAWTDVDRHPDALMLTHDDLPGVGIGTPGRHSSSASDLGATFGAPEPVASLGVEA